ncbi:hypothetical protein CS022_22305 [Veronia nyctiphanis]|uniref:DUF6475 domain-containing protein n=1 Tax=Veronia nyctiphanis TaxID=1278244 RepID=A0A4Q0YK40_9GAMM|nr:DUF6475 domain-containing protein [Veronia nyctiphanis]RXJ70765.1 hypothetical protein CS022_22305 [Veronia nyctiphanis]
MDLSEKTLFAELMCLTASLYMKEPLSRPSLGIYWNALKDFPLEDVRRALDLHLRNTDTGQFFPKPADIIRQMEGNTQTRGELAWTKVHGAIQSVGAWQSVVFDDPIIHQVISDMGGWVSLCHTESDELPYRHNEFVRRYRAYTGQPPTGYPKKLIGISEANNTQSGHEVDDPMVVGNIEKAKEVYQGGRRAINRPQQMSIEDLCSNVVRLKNERS